MRRTVLANVAQQFMLSDLTIIIIIVFIIVIIIIIILRLATHPCTGKNVLR